MIRYLQLLLILFVFLILYSCHKNNPKSNMLLGFQLSKSENAEEQGNFYKNYCFFFDGKFYNNYMDTTFYFDCSGNVHSKRYPIALSDHLDFVEFISNYENNYDTILYSNTMGDCRYCVIIDAKITKDACTVYVHNNDLLGMAGNYYFSLSEAESQVIGYYLKFISNDSLNQMHGKSCISNCPYYSFLCIYKRANSSYYLIDNTFSETKEQLLTVLLIESVIQQHVLKMKPSDCCENKLSYFRNTFNAFDTSIFNQAYKWPIPAPPEQD